MLKDVLKTRRDLLNLKQSDVAEFVGVTPQTYMKWENGKNEPKASNIKNLAEILKVSEMEICRGELFDVDAHEQVEFMKTVASMQRYIDSVTFTSILHKFILDKNEFLSELDLMMRKQHGINIKDMENVPDEVSFKAQEKAELSGESNWERLP
ncbi:helix-turn-helix transcriptional regulator [Vibrio splendidus]|uniref:helix-turn-helix transcriptional regulator n=1 Tax=Vibrio sp. 10N.286.48.C11 TaxID=3229698 RepID=UPI00354CFAE1